MKRSALVLAGWCLISTVTPDAATAQVGLLEGRLATGLRIQVEALVDSARVLGLPTQLIIQKALEGASKDAAPAEILGAVHELLSDLSRARDALGADTPGQVLGLGAAVLEAGATPSELGRLSGYGTHRGLPGALVGVVYLLSRGVEAEASLTIVESMLDAGLGRADFAALQQLVERDIRGGMPSASAAPVRAQALIRRARPGGGPAR